MNRAQGNLRETEKALRLAAKKVRARGIQIVWGAFEEDGPRGGVCVLGAYNRVHHAVPPLALPVDEDRMVAAYDAIEAGFDGEKRGDAPRRWWQLGRRLRRSLRPRRAVG